MVRVMLENSRVRNNNRMNDPARESVAELYCSVESANNQATQTGNARVVWFFSPDRGGSQAWRQWRSPGFPAGFHLGRAAVALFGDAWNSE